MARAQMVSSARMLSTELSSCIATSAATREEIIHDILQLKEERSSEQKLVALLKQQREALQADVAGMQATLEGAKAEVMAARGDVTDLKSSQERSRARTLQSIITFATSELNTLGTELSQSADSVLARLDVVEGETRATGQSLSAAEARNRQISNDVSGEVAAWSQDVVKTMGIVEKKTGTASKAMEGVVSSAAERLKTIDTLDLARAEVHDDGDDPNKENTHLSLSPSTVHDSFKVCSNATDRSPVRTGPFVASKMRAFSNGTNMALKSRN